MDVLLLSALFLAAAQPPEAPPPDYRRALLTLNARRAPSPKAELRGLIQKGATFEVRARVEGPGCEAGWGKLGEDAYVCLVATEPSEQAPIHLPVLVSYPMPTLEERVQYRKTGVYQGVAGEEPLLPYIYGQRGRRGRAPIYASADAFANGAAPIAEAKPDRNMVFVGAQPTAKGEVLLRPDGTVIPSNTVLLYAIDRFGGWDLEQHPLPEGTIPAWATVYDGMKVYRAPSKEAEVGAVLPYHAPLVLLASPTDATGRWWTMPDGLGPGIPGYVEDRGGLRHVTVVPPPAGVTGRWLDVDLSEQVLMVWEDGRLRYATLVSTGKKSDETPTGLYRIGDKAIFWDMQSLPDAKEPYFVEGVPWVMHFAPRYALHGAFWHWNFGHTRSHGCINLSPVDARWLFEHVAPYLPAGWSTVYETPLEPGTVLRVRDQDRVVVDRRRELR